MKTRKLPPFLMLNTEGGDGGGGNQTPPAPGPDNNSTGQQQTPPAGAEQLTGDAAELARLREENARYQREAEQARVNAKAKVANDAKKQQLLSVAEIAGIKIEKPDEETIETLTAKLAGTVAAAKGDDEATVKARRDAAFATAAWAAGAPADKATYLQFLASQDAELAKLDVNAADYQTSVNARIKAIVDADPIFKATPGGTSRSGAEDFGGAGGPETVTQDVFDKMTIQEQTNLYRKNPDLFRRLSGQAA